MKLISHYLLINRNDTTFYRTKNKKYVKGYGFLCFARNFKKQLYDTGLDAVKTASKKVVHKAGGFLRNKIAKTNDDKIVKPFEDSRNLKEIIISPEKRDEKLNKLRKVL